MTTIPKRSAPSATAAMLPGCERAELKPLPPPESLVVTGPVGAGITPAVDMDVGCPSKCQVESVGCVSSLERSEDC